MRTQMPYISDAKHRLRLMWLLFDPAERAYNLFLDVTVFLLEVAFPLGVVMLGLLLNVFNVLEMMVPKRLRHPLFNTMIEHVLLYL